MSETEALFQEPEALPPSPAMMPRTAHQTAQPDSRGESEPSAFDDFDGDDVPDHVKKMRRENRNLRERLRQVEAGSGEGDEVASQRIREELKTLRRQIKDAEPILKAHQEAEEANKTELQRLQEALAKEQQGRTEIETGYTRLEMAVQYNIPPDDIDLIGSGSREEMEARAARLGALHAASTKTPPPPSNRPVEGLRPGATPEPPKPADDSYPTEWLPIKQRDKVRSQYGQ